MWVEFWGTFIQDSVDNMTSVAAFDLEKDEEMIGISIAKDLNYLPEGFEEKYMKDLNYISAVMALEEEMIARATPEIQTILRQKGVVMDIWGVAIKK